MFVWLVGGERGLEVTALGGSGSGLSGVSVDLEDPVDRETDFCTTSRSLFGLEHISQPP